MLYYRRYCYYNCIVTTVSISKNLHNRTGENGNVLPERWHQSLPGRSRRNPSLPVSGIVSTRDDELVADMKQFRFEDGGEVQFFPTNRSMHLSFNNRRIYTGETNFYNWSPDYPRKLSVITRHSVFKIK